MEVLSINLLLWPLIWWKNHAVTYKWFNSSSVLLKSNWIFSNAYFSTIFSDVNLVWSPNQIPLLDVDLNVLSTPIAPEITFVNNKNVLSDLTLVIPALVVLELFAPLDPVETQFADVNLVWSPTPTPSLAVNPNVLLTLIVEPVTTSVKTKSKTFYL